MIKNRWSRFNNLSYPADIVGCGLAFRTPWGGREDLFYIMAPIGPLYTPFIYSLSSYIFYPPFLPKKEKGTEIKEDLFGEDCRTIRFYPPLFSPWRPC